MSHDVIRIVVEGQVIYLNAYKFINETWDHSIFEAYRSAAWKDGYEKGRQLERDRQKADIEIADLLERMREEEISAEKEKIAKHHADLLRENRRRQKSLSAAKAYEKHRDIKNMKKILAEKCVAAYEPWGEESPDHVEKQEIQDYLTGVR